MPNWVGNNVVVRGAETEISRFVSQCFHADDEDDDGIEFCFDTIVPIGVAESASVTDPFSDPVKRLWGVRRDAFDTVILAHEAECLRFEFTTASDFPEPVYRELGRIFPGLAFDIAAIDPGAWWAVTGRIVGDHAVFDENADCRKVYERIYKEPLENALMVDT